MFNFSFQFNMLSSFKIIVLFSLNLLIKIEADDPCENPCVNFCLKPECKGCKFLP